jgi:hypothetical protein
LLKAGSDTGFRSLDDHERLTAIAATWAFGVPARCSRCGSVSFAMPSRRERQGRITAVTPPKARRSRPCGGRWCVSEYEQSNNKPSNRQQDAGAALAIGGQNQRRLTEEARALRDNPRSTPSPPVGKYPGVAPGARNDPPPCIRHAYRGADDCPRIQRHRSDTSYRLLPTKALLLDWP